MAEGVLPKLEMVLQKLETLETKLDSLDSHVKHRHAMRAEPMTFFSQYGEIYPDNLWDFTSPVSPP